MNDNQYTEILRQFGVLRDMLQTRIPRKKREALVETKPTLHRERVAELERIFWKLVNSTPEKRRDSYRFPKALVEKLGQPTLEAVVVSVLVNQASLRKIFQVRGPEDPRHENAATCVRRILRNANLMELSLQDTTLPSESETMIALSPGEASRRAKSYVELPASWPGWSCAERAKPVRNPFAVGMLEVPEDPCGARDWSVGENEPELEYSLASEPEEQDEEEFVEEDEYADLADSGEDEDDGAAAEAEHEAFIAKPAPVKKGHPRVDFSELETPAPEVGYRQRVHFPED